MADAIDDLLRRYANGGSTTRLPADAGAAWQATTTASGRLGAARVDDSAHRKWRVEVHRDERGRYLVVSPVRGDNEPFRASADGYRPDAYLPISPDAWSLLALLAWGHDGDEGRADEELRREAFRLVSRLVVEAQHQGLMGAADDEE